jgi:hypothetical protein
MRSIATIFCMTIGCNVGFQTGANPDADWADADGSFVEPCEAIARTVSPASGGQVNFFHRDDIVFSVTDGADTATIHLVDGFGEPVEGTTWVDDRVAKDSPLLVVFTPESPLAVSSDFIATLDYCAGTPSISFHTSSLGTALDTQDVLLDQTFTIDLSQAKVEQPDGAAQVLLSLLDNDLALQVNGLEGDTLDITVAATTASDGEQDSCTPTLDFNMPGNFAEAPAFMLGPMDIPFNVAGYTLMLYDSYASATFAADGSFFAGGQMAGSLDARDVVDALAGYGVLPSDNPDALCLLLGQQNLACGTCRDGEEYCLHIEISDVMGSQSNLDLRTLSAIDCDEDCAASCDNSECQLAEDFPICEG